MSAPVTLQRLPQRAVTAFATAMGLQLEGLKREELFATNSMLLREPHLYLVWPRTRFGAWPSDSAAPAHSHEQARCTRLFSFRVVER